MILNIDVLNNKKIAQYVFLLHHHLNKVVEHTHERKTQLEVNEPKRNKWTVTVK